MGIIDFLIIMLGQAEQVPAPPPDEILMGDEDVLWGDEDVLMGDE